MELLMPQWLPPIMAPVMANRRGTINSPKDAMAKRTPRKGPSPAGSPRRPAEPPRRHAEPSESKPLVSVSALWLGDSWKSPCREHPLQLGHSPWGGLKSVDMGHLYLGNSSPVLPHGFRHRPVPVPVRQACSWWEASMLLVGSKHALGGKQVCSWWEASMLLVESKHALGGKQVHGKPHQPGGPIVHHR